MSYVPPTGFVSVTISRWFGPLPELPASPPFGPKTARSQSPEGARTIFTWNWPAGGSIVSEKWSQVESPGPLQPAAVATVNAPVHVTDRLVAETVPAPGVAARGEASGSARTTAATTAGKRNLSAFLDAPGDACVMTSPCLDEAPPNRRVHMPRYCGLRNLTKLTDESIRRGVAAHAVDEQRVEPVGELVRVAAGLQPRVRPVGGGEREQRGGRVVEVGA